MTVQKVLEILEVKLQFAIKRRDDYQKERIRIEGLNKESGTENVSTKMIEIYHNRWSAAVNELLSLKEDISS